MFREPRKQSTSVVHTCTNLTSRDCTRRQLRASGTDANPWPLRLSQTGTRKRRHQLICTTPTPAARSPIPRPPKRAPWYPNRWTIPRTCSRVTQPRRLRAPLQACLDTPWRTGNSTVLGSAFDGNPISVNFSCVSLEKLPPGRSLTSQRSDGAKKPPLKAPPRRTYPGQEMLVSAESPNPFGFRCFPAAARQDLGDPGEKTWESVLFVLSKIGAVL